MSFTITREHLTCEHWPKQQGTFGEYLALWYLGKMHEMRGYHVDSSGADIILVDPNKTMEAYAVSVKTFSYQSKKESYTFETDHKDKLISFAKKWSYYTTVKPMLCFNLIRSENDVSTKIYLMAFTMDYVSELASTANKTHIYSTDSGIVIKYDPDSLEQIKNDKKIIFAELDISTINKYLD